MTSDASGPAIPQFDVRGERNRVGPSWDYYDCPGCGEPVCSFCDCPFCGWYDADAWRTAILQTARERENIYTGSLEVAQS